MTQAKKAVQRPKKRVARASPSRKPATGISVAKKRSRPARSAPAARRVAKPQDTAKSKPKRSKSAQVILLLSRKDGATLPELMTATGWQAHSVRGFLSGTVRKRLQLLLHSKGSDAGRCYWIGSDSNAKRPS
jgi:hypothetical protein